MISHGMALEVRAHNVILTLSHSRGTLHWKFNRPKKPITICPSTDFHGSNSSGLRPTSTLSVTHSLRSGPSDGLHDGVHVEVTQAGGGRTNTHCFISHLHMHLHELGQDKQYAQFQKTGSCHRVFQVKMNTHTFCNSL